MLKDGNQIVKKSCGWGKIQQNFGGTQLQSALFYKDEGDHDWMEAGLAETYPDGEDDPRWSYIKLEIKNPGLGNVSNLPNTAGPSRHLGEYTTNFSTRENW